MKTVFCLLLLTLGTSLAAQSLRTSEELTLPARSMEAVPLDLPSDGQFRLEAVTLGGEPLEVRLEKRTASGQWSPSLSNRGLTGQLAPAVEFQALAHELWRVKPAGATHPTMVLRLTKLAFSALKKSLKTTLTGSGALNEPLRRRLSLPLGTGGPILSAVGGIDGSLWVCWLTPSGEVEVWDAGRSRPLGLPWSAQGGPWTRVLVEGRTSPEVGLENAGASAWRVWTGTNWIDEAPFDSYERLNTEGQFRLSSSAPPSVERLQDSQWVDLGLPRTQDADLARLGSTSDGLYVALASSQTSFRALYAWTPARGWLALPPPNQDAAADPQCWALSSRAGLLFHIEREADRLLLRSYDGTQWSAPLDLTPMIAGRVKAACFVAPSAFSRSGNLVVATDRVQVFELP